MNSKSKKAFVYLSFTIKNPRKFQSKKIFHTNKSLSYQRYEISS